MNNVMKYKGYWAKIQYSEADECFWGEIEGINDSIFFEGTNVDELKRDFEEAIDSYIHNIVKGMVKNHKNNIAGSFNIRIAPEPHREASILSKVRDISLNQFVERAIEKEVKLSLNQ